MSKKFVSLATTIALFLGLIVGINGYVYPRREGENLEKRVDRMDKRSKESEKRLKKDISYIIKKIDSMYIILLKKI